MNIKLNLKFVLENTYVKVYSENSHIATWNAAYPVNLKFELIEVFQIFSNSAWSEILEMCRTVYFNEQCKKHA